MSNEMKKIMMVLLTVIVAACGNYEETKGFVEVGSARLDRTKSISFKEVSEQIFKSKCTSCHIQYESYAGVVNELGAIRSAVASNRMPKNMPALNSAQKELLFAWIDAGAPQGGSVDSGPIDPVPLVPTWQSLSSKVFYPKCTSCHNPNGEAKFLDLSTRQAWFDGRSRDFGGITLLDFDHPQESYLLEVINDPYEPMPPLWSNIAQLTEEEKEVLIEWIRKGLP